MSFSQTSILSVNPPVQNGTQLLLSWTSTAPEGTLYQVYLNQQLAWCGLGLACSISMPTALSRIDIGTVASADVQANLVSELPATPSRQATLSWLGGTFQGADIGGFHIYGELTPGSGIDYTTIVATIPAYIAGIITDGFGYGGFGQGGFGQSAGSYSWTLRRYLELERHILRHRRQRGRRADRCGDNHGSALATFTVRQYESVGVHLRQRDQTSDAELEPLSLLGEVYGQYIYK
jgi:hypothetical protein